MKLFCRTKNKGLKAKTRSKLVFYGKTIVTCGTFLSGKIHIGSRKILAGRMGESRAGELQNPFKARSKIG